MIRNQWYVVLDSKQVKKDKPLGILRMGENLVFWRNPQGKVVCMRNQCPHLGAQLSQGMVVDDRLRCPFHGFEYGLDGKCEHVPSVGKNGTFPRALEVMTYPTHEEHGFIWIYWGKSEAELKPPIFYEDLDSTYSYGSFQQKWPVHYSRMVENQLDVMHLPFIHYNTIGAGGRAVVEGPLVKLENDVINLWVYNRKDDGTPARRADQLPEPTRPPFLIFNFPNLWMNRISDTIRIIIAFVPVDEENGILYGRYYQNIVRIPILRELFNYFGVLGSIVIANQDHRVVSFQNPKKTSLKKMGEILLPGDRGILTYRTRRHQLKVEAGQIEEE